MTEDIPYPEWHHPEDAAGARFTWLGTFRELLAGRALAEMDDGHPEPAFVPEPVRPSVAFTTPSHPEVPPSVIVTPVRDYKAELAAATAINIKQRDFYIPAHAWDRWEGEHVRDGDFEELERFMWRAGSQLCREARYARIDRKLAQDTAPGIALVGLQDRIISMMGPKPADARHVRNRVTRALSFWSSNYMQGDSLITIQDGGNRRITGWREGYTRPDAELSDWQILFMDELVKAGAPPYGWSIAQLAKMAVKHGAIRQKVPTVIRRWCRDQWMVEDRRNPDLPRYRLTII